MKDQTLYPGRPVFHASSYQSVPYRIAFTWEWSRQLSGRCLDPERDLKIAKLITNMRI